MLLLRIATDSDKSLVLAWRNLVYQGSFYSQKTFINWEEHDAWFKSRNRDWREFIIDLYENDIIRPIGVVTIGQLDYWSPEIGYFIGNPTDWGRGYGKEAVSQALEWLRRQGKEYCHTTVLKSNKRSIKLLKRLGFKILGDAREEELWLAKKLSY